MPRDSSTTSGRRALRGHGPIPFAGELPRTNPIDRGFGPDLSFGLAIQFLPPRVAWGAAISMLLEENLGEWSGVSAWAMFGLLPACDTAELAGAFDAAGIDPERRHDMPIVGINFDARVSLAAWACCVLARFPRGRHVDGGGVAA